MPNIYQRPLPDFRHIPESCTQILLPCNSHQHAAAVNCSDVHDVISWLGMQGITHLDVCFYEHESFTVDTLQPLQCLRRLRKVVLENKARAQPTLMGLGHLGSQQMPLLELHVKAFVVGVDSGIDRIRTLRRLDLSNCILMIVRLAAHPCIAAAKTLGTSRLNESVVFHNNSSLLCKLSKLLPSAGRGPGLPSTVDRPPPFEVSSMQGVQRPQLQAIRWHRLPALP